MQTQPQTTNEPGPSTLLENFARAGAWDDEEELEAVLEFLASEPGQVEAFKAFLKQKCKDANVEVEDDDDDQVVDDNDSSQASGDELKADTSDDDDVSQEDKVEIAREVLEKYAEPLERESAKDQKLLCLEFIYKSGKSKEFGKFLAEREYRKAAATGRKV